MLLMLLLVTEYLNLIDSCWLLWLLLLLLLWCHSFRFYLLSMAQDFRYVFVHSGLAPDDFGRRRSRRC